jgi:hypothetical protein
MTRETKEELLLTMLFFGFRLLRLSLPVIIGASKVLASPNTGTLSSNACGTPFEGAVPISLLTRAPYESEEDRFSLKLSYCEVS